LIKNLFDFVFDLEYTMWLETFEEGPPH